MNVLLTKWAEENRPKDEMTYKRAYYAQVAFMEYLLPRLGFNINDTTVPTVISTHTSKSISLPVCEFNIAGVRIIMRDNFHDWKLSVISPIPLEGLDVYNLFLATHEIYECYCEGFPEELVFGAYETNNKEFTIEVNDEYRVMAVLTLIMDRVRNYKHAINTP